jgi:hypothetical protein
VRGAPWWRRVDERLFCDLGGVRGGIQPGDQVAGLRRQGPQRGELAIELGTVQLDMDPERSAGTPVGRSSVMYMFQSS